MDEQGQKNYYNQPHDSVGGLKYRTDPTPTLNRVIDTFSGTLRDKYGREIGKDFPIMNDEGIARLTGLLRGMITSITHLTYYVNEERINRQMRGYMGRILYVIARNRKKWDIKNREIVVTEIEKLLHESMLRANTALEANLTAKQHQVSELVQHNPPRQGGGVRTLFSRNREEGEY